MPVAKQTRPPARPSPNGAAKTDGSILSRAVPVSEMMNEYVSMLLYGRNRVGKTTLACQFPKPLLMVSCEPGTTGGARSVSKVPGVKVLRLHPTDPKAQLHHSDELHDVATELKDSEFKTVVVDSGTSLDEIVLAEICGWDDTATMLAVGHTRPGAKVSGDQYTQRSEVMRKIFRLFLRLEKHVVICANEKDHNTEKGQENRKSAVVRSLHLESFFAAAMGGGTTRWTQDATDFCCQLLVDDEVKPVVYDQAGEKVTMLEPTGRQIRRLRCQYHPNFAAGPRSPDRNTPEFIDEPTWEKIKAMAEGRPVPK